MESPDQVTDHHDVDEALVSLPDSPKSSHEQVCFDDEEAELVPQNKSPAMEFEGAGCVHPSRPQEAVETVQDLEDDSEAEHEASSLAGSVTTCLLHFPMSDVCQHDPVFTQKWTVTSIRRHGSAHTFPTSPYPSP